MPAPRLLAAALCTTCILSQAVTLSEPTVELQLRPIGIDVPSPRISWLLSTPSASTSTPGITQTSYRITVQVGRQVESICSSSGPFLWDTGVVSSNASGSIPYAGPTLAPDSDFTLCVALVLSSRATPSTSTLFSTALSNASAWSGSSWIGGFNQLRTNFKLPSDAVSITRARLYATGVGCVQLYLNGEVLDRPGLNASLPPSYLNPGFSTVYSARLLYMTFDVAALVSPTGPNALGMRLGMCKYGYLGEFCTTGPADCNRGILLLSILYSDANGVSHSFSVPSDASWMGIQSEIVSDHLYNGETVNATIAVAQQGWSSAGYVPGPEWAPVVVKASPTAQLSSHMMPPVTVWAQRPTANVTQLADGSYVFDVAQNAGGTCTLTLPPPLDANVNVTLVHGELRNPDGSVFVQFHCPCACCQDGGNCANQTHTYLTAGGSTPEVFSPTFNYGGFRYVQLFGWPASTRPPVPSDLVCVSISSGVQSIGNVSFNGSTGVVLNAIQNAIIQSQRSNLVSIPTDCPQREKRGWTADAHVSSAQASYNFDMTLLYENYLRTHADTQSTGCGPLLPNNTCPKWQNSQPNASYVAYDVLGGGSSETDSVPNCYICCYGRPGFGCQYFGLNTTGSVADVMPFDKNGYGSMPGSICWTSISFVLTDVLLTRYNDVEGLAPLYDFLVRHMGFYNFLATTYGGADALIIYEQYGDWNAIGRTSKLLLSNAYYVYDALVLASLATALGKSADAAVYTALAAAVNTGVTAQFWNATGNFWDTGSQAAQAVPLMFGIAAGDASKTAAAAAQVVVAAAAAGDHVTTGTIGTRFILQALDLANASSAALEMLNTTTAPGWGSMVVGDSPLGTLWESWTGGTSSYNHIMFGGGPGLYFYENALGLRFRHVCSSSSRASVSAALTKEDAAVMVAVGVAPAWERMYGLPRSVLRSAAALAARVRGTPAASSLPGLHDAAATMAAADVKSDACGSRVPELDITLDAHLVRSLGSASGTFSSTHGTILVDWNVPSDAVLHMKVRVPYGVSAATHVPLALLGDAQAVRITRSCNGMASADVVVERTHAVWTVMAGDAQLQPRSRIVGGVAQGDYVSVPLPSGCDWELRM